MKNVIKTTLFASLIAAMIIPVMGISSAHADTYSGSWSNRETSTSDRCGTNLTNADEYACANAHSNGNMAMLAKANGWLETVVSKITVNKNGNTVGSLPEITTSAKKVTFGGQFDVVGEIEEKSGSNVSVIYGVTLYKKSGSNWVPAGYCNAAFSQDGTYSRIDDTMQCVKNNSGTNTYRIDAYAKSSVITNFSSGASYADFYTGSNRIVLDSLSIS